MTDKLPWMPFYGTLFYEDESVALMELIEEAVYIRLLWRQWREGSLPADSGDLEKLARGPVTDRILALLPIGEDGRRRNPHMEEKRVKHNETQAKYAERGRKARAAQDAGTPEADNKPATSPPDAQEVRSKNEETKDRRSAGRIEMTADEQSVVDHYRMVHPKRLRGEIPKKTVSLIRAALLAYPAGDLCRAIDGNATSPFHRENNHLGLNLILRDADKIDYFLGLAGKPNLQDMTDDYGRMVPHRETAPGVWEAISA